MNRGATLVLILSSKSWSWLAPAQQCKWSDILQNCSFPILLFRIWLNAGFQLAVEKTNFLVKLHTITIKFGSSFLSFNFSLFCYTLDTGDKEILRSAFSIISLLFYILKPCLPHLAFSLEWAISWLLCLGKVFLKSLLVFFWQWRQSFNKVYNIMLTISFYVIHYLNIYAFTSLCFFWSRLWMQSCSTSSSTWIKE